MHAGRPAKIRSSSSRWRASKVSRCSLRIAGWANRACCHERQRDRAAHTSARRPSGAATSDGSIGSTVVSAPAALTTNRMRSRLPVMSPMSPNRRLRRQVDVELVLEDRHRATERALPGGRRRIRPRHGAVDAGAAPGCRAA